ncbi:MAG: hypothetical protein ACAI38_18625 [Myxococcota bacterium]
MRPLALATLLFVAPTLAFAGSLSLAQAEQAYAALDFDQVMPLLARAGRETLTPEEEQRRRELTAVMHAIYERPVLARNGFLEVLAYEPRYQLPDGSAPKIRLAFEDALSARDAMGVKPAPPVTKQWWFWAGVGALVVGSIVAVGIAASNHAPEHDYGPYALP